MAGSTIVSANQTTRFQSEVRREYVRGGRFGPYIGKTENAIIQVKQYLKKVSIPLVGKLKSAGVSGSSTLGGNEEALSNFAATLQPTYWRNGVLIDNEENEKPEFNLFQEARPALMNWAMEKKRDQIIQAMGAVEAGGTYLNYGGTEGAFGSTAASAANMDTWNTNNQDRVLYGSVKSNNTSGNHTTSLSSIDTTNDKLDSGIITLLKRMAETARPLIRPVKVKSDEPWYVFFVDPYGFRDLKEDSTIAQANREARPREVMDNPIFTGGDLVYDGVIIKKIPEIAIFIDGDSSGSPWDGVWGAGAASADGLDDGGDTSSRVGIGFFCGAQAVGLGLGRMPSFKRRKEDDYEHLSGVGLTMKHDIKKIFYNNKQHGMITSFFSAALDS
jgi:hypothetical protein